MAEQTTEPEANNVREGKYLTFNLGEEQYGLGILTVQEIIQMMKITTVPQTPDYIKGIINLRGRVIGIVDLRHKFGLPEVEETSETCIIVVEVSALDSPMTFGIIVDSVSEVIDVQESDIEDPPTFGSQIQTDFIRGLGKIGGKVKILLDIDRVLSFDEMKSIPGIKEQIEN